MRPACEVAQVIDQEWDSINSSVVLNVWQKRTLRLLRDCRTSAMGGHVDRCPDCSYLRISYNSCRNRHCPKCQVMAKEDWVQARKEELLPVPYFHVVFTMPEQVNRLCLFAPAKVYDTLFASAWSTISDFAADTKHLSARTGMIAVLHTWGQNLSLHPHLHCIVPGGGLNASGNWKTARSNGKYLFPVEALSKVFRARMVALLRKHFPNEEKAFFEGLFKTEWVVYAKRPFGGPKQVIDYLGRYTHKIAISNHRLTTVTDEQVSFRYKNYRNGQQGLLSLSPLEFIRRFAQHILPKGFVRIRHYGLLSSRTKSKAIPSIHLQLSNKIMTIQKQERRKAPPVLCPCCKKATLQTIMRFDHRGPPDTYSVIKPSKYAA